jgi:hypothetical protein
MSNYEVNEGSFGYSEATATWTTRYVDPSGFECLLSIQAESGSEVLTKAQGALERLGELKCVPHTQRQPDNGNEQKKLEKQAPTVQVKRETNTGKVMCPIHNIEMTLWTKGTRSWYSHRWKDGWCNGKNQ